MLASGAARADDGSCDREIPLQKQKFGGPKGDTNSQPNLKIDKPCWIDIAGTYVYGNINIIGPNGSLEFRDPAAKGSQVNFWAKNIIVENGGTLKAGTATAPYGSRGGVLTIYLYGADQTKASTRIRKLVRRKGSPAGPTRATRLGSGLAASRPRRQAARISMAPGATTVKLPSRSTPTRRMTFSTSMAPCPGTRGVPTRTPSRTTRPPGVLEGQQWNRGLHQSEIPSRLFRLQGPGRVLWRHPAALRLQGHAAAQGAAPPPTRRFRFFGDQGTFNPQGAMGAPSQFASQSAPGTGSPGGLFFKWFHGHFGNGGGGNGGGGHHPCAPSTASATTASCGGGGGGGGLGGEAGTCASDLTVGTNTKLTPDDVPTSTGCSWLRLAATTARTRST